MSGTNTINSEATNITNVDNIGFLISWTGTPTGIISIQCAIENPPLLGQVDQRTWIALTFDPALAQPAGSAGSYLVNVNQAPFTWIRVSYTNSSGSGVLTAKIMAKDIN